MRLARRVLCTATVLPLALLAFATAGFGQDDAPNIAVVNLEAVFAQSPIGQKLQADIQQLEQRTEAELTKERDAIATLRQQEATATAEQRLELERRRQDHERSARRISEDAIRQAQKMETESRREFSQKIEGLFRALQQENGWDLILNKASGFVIFAGESLDVTALVLERMNAGD